MENIKKAETILEKFEELTKTIDLFFENAKVPRPVIVEADGFIKDVKEFIEKNSKQPKK